MLIRPIEAHEIERAGELTVEASTKPPSGDGVPLHMGDYADELRDVEGRARLAEVLVAIEAGDLLGCVTYVDDPRNALAEFDDEDAAGIRMLAVAAHAQRRGHRHSIELLLTNARSAALQDNQRGQ